MKKRIICTISLLFRSIFPTELAVARCVDLDPNFSVL